MSNLLTAPWCKPVDTAALKSIRREQDWVKTAEHFNILGQRESICGGPPGKTFSSSFSWPSLRFYPSSQKERENDKTVGAAIGYEHETDKNLLSPQDLGIGRQLFYIPSMFLKQLLIKRMQRRVPQRSAAAKTSCSCCCCGVFVPPESHQIRLITLGVHNLFDFIVLPLTC